MRRSASPEGRQHHGRTAAGLGRELIPRSDTAKAYALADCRAGLRHEPVNIAAGEHGREEVFPIRNVNAHDSRLENGMRRFRGVATRYRSGFVAWHRMNERLAATTMPSSVLSNCCV